MIVLIKKYFPWIMLIKKQLGFLSLHRFFFKIFEKQLTLANNRKLEFFWICFIHFFNFLLKRKN